MANKALERTKVSEPLRGEVLCGGTIFPGRELEDFSGVSSPV